MPKHYLSLPQERSKPKKLGLDLRPQSLEKWLAELPITNTDLSGMLFTELLSNLNRAELKAAERFVVLEQVAPTAHALIETLRQKYTRAPLPLTDKIRKAFDYATQMQHELALGYKTILMELKETPRAGAEQIRMLVHSLYITLFQLTQIMLEHYLVYCPIPAHLWRELHFIFQIAEHNRLLNVSVNRIDQPDTHDTLDFAYKRILLVALSNPYHLMQEEALALYLKLGKLAQGIEFRDFGPEDRLSPAYVVDQRSDRPPFFLSPSRDTDLERPRLLDLRKLMQALQSQLHQLDEKQASEEAKQRSHLTLRMQREMLGRLDESWTRSQERLHERRAQLGKRDVIIGLSAAHYNISRQAPFNPELFEVRVHTRGLQEKMHLRLTLVPKEYEPWKAEDAERRLEAGIDLPRTSNFDADSAVLDTWEKVYAVKKNQEDELLKSREYKSKYLSTPWELRDVSEGGFALYCDLGHCVPVRVGEIVCYPEYDDWYIGTIRWLHAYPDQAVHMGIMSISHTAQAIATRAINGIGKGGEYMRSLLIDAHRLKEEAGRLIVPSSIYDVNTELAVNAFEAIQYVQLTRHCFGTKTFSIFEYKVIGTPSAEQSNIEAIRELV